MDVYSKPKVIGYINDELDSIGKDHFGVVGILKVKGDVVLNDEGEIAEGKFMSVDEMDELFNRDDVEIEGWTKISWPLVKEYLGK